MGFFSTRWLILIFFLKVNSAVLVVPILITGFVLGYFASLNHFHMPMETQPLAAYPAQVFITTQNISNRSFFMTWLSGGLNFHIEHHLFPQVSRYKLHYISPHIEEFARKHALPYSVDPILYASHQVFTKLNKKFKGSK